MRAITVQPRNTPIRSQAISLENSVNGDFGRPLTPDLAFISRLYEYVDGYWIPELFLVSNWTDTSYCAVRPNGFQMTRETYATLRQLQDRPPEQREPLNRRAVHAALHDSPLMFRFNNGDPALFNPVADSVLNTFATLYSRGHVHDSASARTHLSLVRRPVDVVSRLLAEIAEQGSRLIGGKPHDLAVSPTGQYESTTGD